MPIPLECPGCGKRYYVREELAGKSVRCRCGQVNTVPAAAVSAAGPVRPVAGPRRRPKKVEPLRIVVGVLSILYGIAATLWMIVLLLLDAITLSRLVRVLLAVLIVVGGVLILRRHKNGPAFAGLCCLFLCFFPAWWLVIGMLAALTTGQFTAFLILLLVTLIVYSIPAGITVWSIREENAKRKESEDRYY